jgi:hypothetical protein
VLQGYGNNTAGRPCTADGSPCQEVQPRAHRPCGPLPEAEDGSTYILTMIDSTTRWLEAVPLRSMEAATCADAFVNPNPWVTRFGVPPCGRGWQGCCGQEGECIIIVRAGFGASLTVPGQLQSPPETPVQEVEDALRSLQPSPDILRRGCIRPPPSATHDINHTS